VNGGVKVRVIDNADKSPVVGAAVTMSNVNRLTAPVTMLSDKDGITRFRVLPEGVGYVVTTIKDGYSGVRQDATVRGNTTKDILIALAPEHVEKVTVVGEKTQIDFDQTQAQTKFSSDFIQDLPVAGRFYQHALALAPGVQNPDGDGNPNVNGARETDFKTQIGGISNVDPLAGTFVNLVTSDSIEGLTVVTASAGAKYGRPQGGLAQVIQKHGSNKSRSVFYQDMLILNSGVPSAPQTVPAESSGRLRDVAFRVLADLADDGRLSPSDGNPALAALLAAQRKSGAISADPGTQAIATWAVAEAAASDPKDKWIANARAKALEVLIGVADDKLDRDDQQWVCFVLSRLSPKNVLTLHPPSGPPTSQVERLENSIFAARNGARVPAIAGRTPFDRLVSTVGRGKLKVVKA